MDPDFYDRYYRETLGNPLHSEFCRQVFGIDLCQHGFADIEQLHLLIEVGPIRAEHQVLDVGCGNGMITEYVQERTGARFTGLDNARAAIQQARERTRPRRDRLQFIEGDINALRLPAAVYHAVLLIDSIYFSTDYDRTLSTLVASLRPGGCLLILYSIGPALLGSRTFPLSILEAGNTPLAQALHRNGLAWVHRDLTTQDYELARKRRQFLAAHREDFEQSGIGFIYENRMGDATGVIEAVEGGLHRRDLYRAGRT